MCTWAQGKGPNSKTNANHQTKRFADRATIRTGSFLRNSPYTVKKGYRFSRPQPGCHQPNSPWPGIIKFFPGRESLVSDIPTGDGENDNFFYSVYAEG